MNWIIANGSVLGAKGWEARTLSISGERLGPANADATRYDAGGCWVLPGLIDVHGDAFERIVEPRPGVRFDLPDALAETDRQLVSNGITTAFHGVTVSWEPGIRSADHAAELIAAITAQPTRCDMRINIRWEVYALDAVRMIADWLRDLPDPVLSINDHTTAEARLDADHRKIRRLAERTGRSPNEAVAMLQGVLSRTDEVPSGIDQLCRTAREHARIMFAHDETTPQQRIRGRQQGITVSEFPMTAETAIAARVAGEAVVLGAPNVLRGGSQNGAISAAETIRAGNAAVLASDYWYPSMLLAIFRLIDEGMPPQQAWPLVCGNAARAVGLEDRGRLEDGLRADVIVVDPVTRRVRAVWINGEYVMHHD